MVVVSWSDGAERSAVWRRGGRGDFDGVMLLGIGELRAGVLDPASVSAAGLLPGGESILLGGSDDRASSGQSVRIWVNGYS